jgi:hypothetical protein
MNRDRFEALAQAYGGSVARWPAVERDAAAALMTAEPDFARAVLAEAEATHELREAVIAQAGLARARAGLRGWLWGAGAGAGLAAACAAGLIMGVALYSGQTGASEEPIGAVMASYELPAAAQTAGDPT